MNRIFLNIKKIIGVSLLSVLLCGTTAMAEGTSLIEFHGTGRISSDTNGDGVDDVIYDASDISALSEAVSETGDNLEYMETIIEQTAVDAGNARQKVIDAYNGKSFEGNKIPDGSSADTVANAIANTKDSTAFLGLQAGTGDNFLSKGNPSRQNTGNTEVNFENVKDGNIVLDVDQQVTLPAGYYASPVTVSNGVINRGSISYVFTGPDTKEYPEGYYDKGSIASSFTAAQSSYNWKIRHHVHSTANTISYVETNSFEKTTNGPNDGTLSGVRGGCFTVPTYHAHSTGRVDMTAPSANAGPATSTVRGGCFTTPVYKMHVHSDACGWTLISSSRDHDEGTEDGWPHDSWDDALSAGCNRCGANYSWMRNDGYSTDTSDDGWEQRKYHHQYSDGYNSQTDDTHVERYYGVNISKKESKKYHVSRTVREYKVYRRACGKSYGQRYSNEGVEYYAPACGKNQTTVSYALSCGKLKGEIVYGSFITN